MERAHVRTRRLPPLQRSFERSRLEEQLVAAAYELAIPIRRLSLSNPQRHRADAARPNPPSTAQGGLSA
jgi:hypothetical protein